MKGVGFFYAPWSGPGGSMRQFFAAIRTYVNGWNEKVLESMVAIKEQTVQEDICPNVDEPGGTFKLGQPDHVRQFLDDIY